MVQEIQVPLIKSYSSFHWIHPWRQRLRPGGKEAELKQRWETNWLWVKSLAAIMAPLVQHYTHLMSYIPMLESSQWTSIRRYSFKKPCSGNISLTVRIYKGWEVTCVFTYCIWVITGNQICMMYLLGGKKCSQQLHNFHAMCIWFEQYGTKDT